MRLSMLFAVGLLFAGGVCGQQASRPNIVLILADDLGWSDISCFGGEIETPSLARLAENGLLLTQMYSTARCCPTRASLLTGLYQHQAGIGHMTSEGPAQSQDLGLPGYRGELLAGSATLAEVLGGSGYRTLMSGKWHVGTFRGNWPLERGFDRYFGLVRGASNFWRPGPEKLLCFGNTPIEPPPGFYATDSFTDHALAFVREAEAEDERPFFLYLAYTAPHWPLHAQPADVERYRGRYRSGWDQLRAERHARQVELGLVPQEWSLSGRDAPAWEDVEPARVEELDLRMALYAAQVDRMDQGIGRLLELLEELGELEQTLIVFLADNGGCAEGGTWGGGPARQLETQEGYFLSYGQGWANASNTPFRRYKHWVHEGGIASPCVVHWPAGIAARGELRREPTHLVDLMPTLVELAGADYPEERAGQQVPPPEGVSLLPLFAGEALPERALFFEHEGNIAVRRGRWKLVSTAGRELELYDMLLDRTETNDLVEERPELAQALLGEWRAWADRAGVEPWPPRRVEGYRPPERRYPATWVDLREGLERARATSAQSPFLGAWSSAAGERELLNIEPERVARLRGGERELFHARLSPRGAILQAAGVATELALKLSAGGALIVGENGSERSFARLEVTPPELSVELPPVAQASEPSRERVAEVCAALARRAGERRRARSQNDEPGSWRALEEANSEAMLELVAEVGWIDAGRFGARAALDAMELVQGARGPGLLEAVMPFLEDEVLKGSVDADAYALLHDRMRIATGRLQRFGSQLGAGADGALKLLPLEDPTRVHVWRAELGMAPLADFLARSARRNGGRPVRLE